MKLYFDGYDNDNKIKEYVVNCEGVRLLGKNEYRGKWEYGFEIYTRDYLQMKDNSNMYYRAYGEAMGNLVYGYLYVTLEHVAAECMTEEFFNVVYGNEKNIITIE